MTEDNRSLLPAVTTTVKQTMVVDHDTLVITDPCYIMTSMDWDNWLSIYDTKGVSLLDYLHTHKNFGELLCDDTSVGDWGNFVKNTTNNQIIGEFAADAGMVICCTMSDLMKYEGFDKEKLERYADRGLAVIIPDFTGNVVLEKEEENGVACNTVIRGFSDDFNFSTRQSF